MHIYYNYTTLITDMIPGHYVYTEASAFNEGDQARLISPPLHTSTSEIEHCLSVYYHMRGRSVETLKIYRYYETYRKLVEVLKYSKGQKLVYYCNRSSLNLIN